MTTLTTYKKQYHSRAVNALIDLMKADIVTLTKVLDDAKTNEESDNVRIMSRTVHGAVVGLLCVANQFEVMANIQAELNAMSDEQLVADFNNPKETT